MKSKFKKAKLGFSKDFLQSNKQKSLFKNALNNTETCDWRICNLNTFANRHHTMDENSKKINVFEIALNNQKQKWKVWHRKPKDQKDKFQESVKQQLSWNKDVDGHKKRFCQANKKSPKARLTQRLNSISLPWWNRAAKIPSKKSCVL